MISARFIANFLNKSRKNFFSAQALPLRAQLLVKKGALELGLRTIIMLILFLVLGAIIIGLAVYFGTKGKSSIETLNSTASAFLG